MTTDKYHGFVSLIETDINKSWVARYLAGTDSVQGEKDRVAGIYAVKVFEEMESGVEAEIEGAQEALAEAELSEPDEDYQEEDEDEDGSATSEESEETNESSEHSSEDEEEEEEEKSE